MTKYVPKKSFERQFANSFQMCDLRKKAHLQKSYKPTGSADNIASGVYYLEEIDDMFRRKYQIKA